MVKSRVLFICIHNSARSQMAEAFLKQIAGDKFEVASAGLEPGVLNQDVVKVLAEVGLDISQSRTKSALDFFKQGKKFEYVVAVCSPEAAKRCPVFPGLKKQLHWPFKDPSQTNNLDEIRKIRDDIRVKVKQFAKEEGN